MRCFVIIYDLRDLNQFRLDFEIFLVNVGDLVISACFYLILFGFIGILSEFVYLA